MKVHSWYFKGKNTFRAGYFDKSSFAWRLLHETLYRNGLHYREMWITPTVAYVHMYAHKLQGVDVDDGIRGESEGCLWRRFTPSANPRGATSARGKKRKEATRRELRSAVLGKCIARSACPEGEGRKAGEKSKWMGEGTRVAKAKRRFGIRRVTAILPGSRAKLWQGLLYSTWSGQGESFSHKATYFLPLPHALT